MDPKYEFLTWDYSDIEFSLVQGEKLKFIPKLKQELALPKKDFNNWCTVEIEYDKDIKARKELVPIKKPEKTTAAYEIDTSDLKPGVYKVNLYASVNVNDYTLIIKKEDPKDLPEDLKKEIKDDRITQLLKFNLHVLPKPHEEEKSAPEQKPSEIINSPTSPLHVKLQRSTSKARKNIALWGIIQRINANYSVKELNKVVELKSKSGKIKSYQELVDLCNTLLLEKVLSEKDIEIIKELIQNRHIEVENPDNLLKDFYDYLISIDPDSEDEKEKGRTLPYISSLKRNDPSFSYDKLLRYRIRKDNERIVSPVLIELIWTYWHEESMIMQTIKLISLRFQNTFSPATRNQLVNFTTDPLRPLGNLIWDFINNENDLLTVKRRAFEYDQQYGLKLYGKAVTGMKSVDSRSKFLDAFHNLLHLCTIFYREMDDTTIFPDGFPIKNSLRELQLVLAEGGTNQYGDLPWTSRVEMLAVKYILGQKEMKEFLRGRPMVRYEEDWMEVVDTMKRIQGWNDTSSHFFYELAVKGEGILLSVRYGDWNESDTTADDASTWAAFWREDIQAYIHAYRTVTGVDLTKGVNTEMPGMLIMRKSRQAISNT